MTLKFDIRGSRTLGALWLWARRADKRRNGRAAGCIDLKFDIRGSHTRENVNNAITGKELTYQQIVQHTDWAGKPRPLVALTNAPHRSGSTHASPAALLRATRPARQQSASTHTSTPPPHPRPRLTEFRFSISDFRFWILDFGFWISDFRFQISLVHMVSDVYRWDLCDET